MIQKRIYPLKDRATAFCRGFKTFHPFVEVAKEGLKRKEIYPNLRESYRVRIACQDTELEKRERRLFESKLAYLSASVGALFCHNILMDAATYFSSLKLSSYIDYLFFGLASIIIGTTALSSALANNVLDPKTFLNRVNIPRYLSLAAFYITGMMDMGNPIGPVCSLVAGVHFARTILTEKVTPTTEKHE